MSMLRDVTEDDLQSFFDHQREPEAYQMAAFAPRDREAFMRHWHTKVLGNPNTRKKTILVENEVAGNILSWEQNGKRLLGYWVGRAYWGRGTATAALAEFVADHEKARPVYAYVAVENLGSIRVLEKCGFQKMGEAAKGPDGVEELLMRLENGCRHG